MTLRSSTPSYIFDFRSSLNALILTASHTIKIHKASGLLVLFGKCLNSRGAVLHRNTWSHFPSV